MILFDPAHPGELIRETLDGLREESGQKLTIQEVAIGLGTTRKTLSAIINGKQSITTEMAIRLGAGFPNTTPEFWLKVQENFDLMGRYYWYSHERAAAIGYAPRPSRAALADAIAWLVQGEHVSRETRMRIRLDRSVHDARAALASHERRVPAVAA